MRLNEPPLDDTSVGWTLRSVFLGDEKCTFIVKNAPILLTINAELKKETDDILFVVFRPLIV